MVMFVKSEMEKGKKKKKKKRYCEPIENVKKKDDITQINACCCKLRDVGKHGRPRLQTRH